MQADEIVPIWALDVQAMLWRLHAARLGGGQRLGHAEHAQWFGPAVRTGQRAAGRAWIRRFLWVYVGVIFAGSIHLGYHYAVDGYFAWALTLALWWAAGRMAQHWEATPALPCASSRAFAESPASL